MTEVTILIRTNPVWNYARFWRTLGMILAVFLPGVFFDSSAMQWFGFLMLILIFVAFIAVQGQGVSIKEARRLLDEIEAREEK